MTTIKLPKRLRETVMRSARAEGLTAAEFLELVTGEHDRRRRFAAVRMAYADRVTDPRGEYDELTGTWDEGMSDGLTDA